MNKWMDMLWETNYYMRYSKDLAMPGVANLALAWHHIVYITEKLAHQHA